MQINNFQRIAFFVLDASMCKCLAIFVLVAITFSVTESEVTRNGRGVFTKNFFGGVWGNRPPLMEWNQPKTSCTCKCGERNEVSRIIGGSPAGVDELPWMAKLIYFKRFYCGGVLINDRYVLTAAHCVKGFMWFMIKVTFGELNRCNATTRPETRFVVRATSNKFSLTNFDNDISLLRLNEVVPMSAAIKPICLPKGNNLYVGVKAVVAGWGTLTEEGKVSCTLQEVEVPVLSNQDCRNTKYTASMITDNMLCAGYPDVGQKDSCQGDSGGPLITEGNHQDKQYILIGVVSWGNGCARAGYPGVYTRVTKYLDWIRENTKDACYCSG